jgi:hypothetical protein
MRRINEEMKIIAGLLAVLAGIIFEGALAPLPLGLLGVVLIGVRVRLDSSKGKQSQTLPLLERYIFSFGDLFGVFIAGVLADILLIRPVGVTGGIYLATIVLLRLYSRKIETERLRYLLVFTGIVIGLYSWYFYREWQFQVVVSLIIVGVVRLVVGLKSNKYDRLRL